MKLKKEVKALIKAMVNVYSVEGFILDPSKMEYEISSKILLNMNSEHRDLVEEFVKTCIDKLEVK